MNGDPQSQGLDEELAMLPMFAIRRHHDRCFHAVEEIVPGGYVVEGLLIDEQDVAQVRHLRAAQPLAVPIPAV
jgi:hypothetical protein